MSGWVVTHGRRSASPLLPFCTLAPGTQDGGFMCVFVHFLMYIQPCQQDKTAVVKQSKQSPLTAAMSPWCDLQTGFLLPSLAILWHAQETHSALPDKKMNQRGKNEHLHQETVILSSLRQENQWTDLPGIFSHRGWQWGNQAGNQRVALFPLCLCLLLSLMCCQAFWHASPHIKFLVGMKSFSAFFTQMERWNLREDKRSNLATKCRVDKWLLCVCVCVPVHALL